MAGRKLTNEEKANYNARMSLTRASKEKEKLAKTGNNPKPKVNGRNFEQIMSDIEKVKQDPKFQAKMQKFRESQAKMSTTIAGGLQIKTPTAPRTVAGINGVGGKNVTPIHKPTSGISI
jgi:hypothetical protein